jgi:hypothetical protein
LDIIITVTTSVFLHSNYFGEDKQAVSESGGGEPEHQLVFSARLNLSCHLFYPLAAAAEAAMARSEAAIQGAFDFRTWQGQASPRQACCLIAFEQKRVAKQSWCLIPFLEPSLEPSTTLGRCLFSARFQWQRQRRCITDTSSATVLMQGSI